MDNSTSVIVDDGGGSDSGGTSGGAGDESTTHHTATNEQNAHTDVIATDMSIIDTIGDSTVHVGDSATAPAADGDVSLSLDENEENQRREQDNNSSNTNNAVSAAELVHVVHDDEDLITSRDRLTTTPPLLVESPSSPPPKNGDVSASTVVITESQFIDTNGNENGGGGVLKSMIDSTTTNEDTNKTANNNTNINTNGSGDSGGGSDDDDSKEYEIPNFEAASASVETDLAAKTDQPKTDLEEITTKTSPSTSMIHVEKKKDDKVRRLEDETFQEILGNASLLKKITQYGDQTLSEFARRPMSGQMVTISYEAYLKDDSKLVDHNDNLSFILGDGDVISGLDMVVSLMDKNEKCEMIVESRHAYGSLGKQPDIPSNATLLYKIHLKEFNDVTDLNMMSPIERLSLADAKKLRGNYHYNRQDFHLAVVSYKKGLAYFNEENLRGDELDDDLKKFADLSQALSMNLALSYYKMGECRDALEALDQVIRLKGNHVKALYIKGKILLQTGDTQEAIKVLNHSLQLDPNNADVKKELAKAQTKHKIQYENEKKMYKKMITAVGKGNEDELAAKLKKSSKSNSASSASYFPYVATGVAIAVASIGIAWLARYKNII